MRRLLPLLFVLILGGAAPVDEPAPVRVKVAGPTEVVRTGYRVEWPSADRLRGLVGIAVILGLAVALSEDRRAIPVRTVAAGLASQVLLAVGLLSVSWGGLVLRWVGRQVELILDCALRGSAFLFGETLVDPGGPAGFVFAFRVLPTIIFVAALFAVLYHLGIMQWIVRAFAWAMVRLMKASGAESLNVAASLFLGQTEAPLTIRPYLPDLTRSELLVVMVSGMALVAGGVFGAYLGAGAEAKDLLVAILLTAPATIYLSKMLVPETGVPRTLGLPREDPMRPDANVLEAAARGTREGLLLAANVAAMLVSFLGLIALLNLGLNALGGAVGREGLTLQRLMGWAFAPVAWLLGVPWGETTAVGGLLGTRLITNELIAFLDLKALKGTLSDRSFSIATIALCGFANLSSIGIQIGGIGALIPSRQRDIAQLGVKALLAATMANFLSACLAGVLL